MGITQLLKKYHYDGVVFFDTFPIRENAILEAQANIKAFEQISKMVDNVGVEEIEKIVEKHDGISAQNLIMKLMEK